MIMNYHHEYVELCYQLRGWYAEWVPQVRAFTLDQWMWLGAFALTGLLCSMYAYTRRCR
jgi:hypothetical protein